VKDIHFGIGIFACCGKPHVVYSSGNCSREEAEADFAESLVNAIPTMGIASQSFLLTMPGEQFMQIEAHYHGLPEPDLQPQVSVMVVDSPEALKQVLKSMGIEPDAPPPTKQ
jgi:hypothetical protein